jgi:integrase
MEIAMDVAFNTVTVKALEVPATGSKTFYFRGAIVAGKEIPPGLGVRVTSNGVRTFIIRYRNHDGIERFHKIGRFPELTVVAAVAKARAIRKQVIDGGDPHKDKQDADTAASNKFKAVCEAYMARGGKGGGKNLRSRKWRERVLERLVYPEIGNIDISAIKRKAVNDLLNKIEKENGPVMADRTLGIVRKVMNWQAVEDENYSSPIVMGMTRSDGKARERTLTDHELRSIWKVAETPPEPFESMIRFILLTGARLNEARRMEWSELDGSDWTLPAARNKTGLDLLRPLSKPALAALPPRTLGRFVFSANDGATPIGNMTARKKNLDELSGVTGWTIHDCRRTARTLLSRAKADPDHAERCLGHVVGGIRGVYDRHEYKDEKKKAYELLADLIQTIINPPTDNVVAFERRVSGS